MEVMVPKGRQFIFYHWDGNDVAITSPIFNVSPKPPHIKHTICIKAIFLECGYSFRQVLQNLFSAHHTHMNSSNQSAAPKLLIFRNLESATIWKSIYDIKQESLQQKYNICYFCMIYKVIVQDVRVTIVTFLT